jgi:hypothetical protein
MEFVGAALLAAILFTGGVVLIGFVFAAIAASRIAVADEELYPPERTKLIGWSSATLAFSSFMFLFCFFVARMAGGRLTFICGAVGLLLLLVSAVQALVGRGPGRGTLLLAHCLIVLWGIAFLAFLIYARQAPGHF